MIHRIVLIVVALTSLALGVPGCARVYQTTMEEMTASESQRFASRVDQLRESSVRTRSAVTRCVEQLRITQAATGREDFDAEMYTLDLSMQRLELHAWNLRRSVASVQDVGEDQLALSDDDHSLPADRYRRLLIDLDAALDATHRMIDMMAFETKLLSADSFGEHTSDDESSGYAATDPRETAAAATSRLDAAIQSADSLLAALPKE